MRRPRSLRQLFVAGAGTIAVALALLTVGILVLFVSLRGSFERDVSAGLAEQRTADDIVTAVYGQLLAAYREVKEPSAPNRARYESLDSVAYGRLRQYLFQPMATDARIQVETIKELHQSLEVDAHQAFDRTGDAAAAAGRIVEMERHVTALDLAMRQFVVLRERERTLEQKDQLHALERSLAAIVVALIVLAVAGILFVRTVMRRVIVPLGQVSQAAVRLGGGELLARIPHQRDDELGLVALSFNDMADNIQAARAEIVDQNAALLGTLATLRQAQQELVQHEKLGAIGLMLAGLAHELNNPLAGLRGIAELLQQELGSHHDPAVRKIVRELVQPLVTEAQRAGSLVRNLLDFSRKAAAPDGPVPLAAAIGVAAGLRQHAFTQAGMTLDVEIADSLYVVAEAQRIEHVAMNIMSNALDAMLSGGGTRVQVRAAAVDGDWVLLTFDDDGPGFREPDRAFDPFYTTKELGSGTGLGLTLVHRFVAEVGGTVSVENLPDRGARVAIRLRAAVAPLRPAVAAHLEPRSVAGVGTAPGHTDATVLVVDDEPVLRDVQRRVLVREGVRVLTADSGAAAIAVLQRETCDLVVTDIRMPGEIDGVGLYQWIRREQPWLAERCLFVSGDIGEWANDPLLGTHPDRFLAKPFGRDEYVARIASLLARPDPATVALLG
ncbi:MAG: ATP-binding protein [Gemmatimonadales bacterium]